MTVDPQSTLREALEAAWSIETSSKWQPDNPACGQCSVTALVDQDMRGGEPARTRVEGAWHFYNIVEGKRLDSSASQFAVPVAYSDTIASREEAFCDTLPEQYRLLWERVQIGLPGRRRDEP
ncbi:YunG family protein [Neorhizobium sp. NPDC001467]|uniref:YunG family protein n=1 Tax=Neorhizobium sp. NPDC001467 TaxID=3390595 RepID=UPI003D029601